MSVQIAVRLADKDLQCLDAAVARGVFPSRAAAMRAGLLRVLGEARETQIAEAYRRGYATDPDAEGVGDTGLALGAAILAARGARRRPRRVTRGEVYDVDWPDLGVRPAIIVTRPTVIAHLTNVTVVLITTRVRGLPTEVELGAAHGLIEGSVANCDNVLTISKTALTTRRGQLGPADTHALDDALRIALALDC